MLKTERVNIIYWCNLEHHGLFTKDFESFSFGDADITLMEPAGLVDELDEENTDGSMDKLVEELESLPADVYVAFEG